MRRWSIPTGAIHQGEPVIGAEVHVVQGLPKASPDGEFDNGPIELLCRQPVIHCGDVLRGWNVGERQGLGAELRGEQADPEKGQEALESMCPWRFEAPTALQECACFQKT
jgi:hypothetical protein